VIISRFLLNEWSQIYSGPSEKKKRWWFFSFKYIKRQIFTVIISYYEYFILHQHFKVVDQFSFLCYLKQIFLKTFLGITFCNFWSIVNMQWFKNPIWMFPVRKGIINIMAQMGYLKWAYNYKLYKMSVNFKEEILQSKVSLMF
jgi:hypothetical protein